MAGNKSQRSGDDKTKKRKREVNDASSKSKRHRKEDKANGHGPNGVRAESPAGGKDEADASNEVIIGGKKISQRRLDMVNQTESATGWKVSKPMGGRMLDIDPILTQDEQYLILAYNTSIQVYSAADSLLVRRIPISTLDSLTPKGSKPAAIVAMRLSKQNSSFVWVACSDGRIFYVDWTKTSEPLESFKSNSGTARNLVVVPIGDKKPQEAVLVVESDKPMRLDITAYLSTTTSKPETKNIFSLKKNGNGLQLLESSEDGRVLTGALNDRLYLGSIPDGPINSLDQLNYSFFSFDAPDIVTSLDLKVDTKNLSSGKSKKSKMESGRVVDVIMGGARGGIYLYQDALTRLQALGKSKSEKEIIQAQKYHWHRKAVHAVKWSQDGNYMISGGSENVLVTWQMDTSKKDFLPHLSGSIENIVVSSRGASYVIHLDDNSVMIISTAEMKPTAYVSGIQSAAVNVSIPKDLLVQRLWTSPEHVRRPIPAAIRPSEPSKVHVCVGNGRQATMTGDFSAPLLQTFDLETFTSIAKQPLARTQPTDVNITNKGMPIDEPLVTHMAFSADGKWLASVDDWKPSERDVDNVSSDLRDQFVQERHEVYLKFWEMGSGDDSAALVSRVNAPHATNQPQTVLDLASNPGSTCFATIGSDGMVRLWQPKLRQQNGIAVKGPKGRDTFSWGCTQVIAVGDGLGQEAAVDLVNATKTSQPQGSVAFSEDGSTIFAAFGGADTGVVYAIDAASGEIVKALEGLWSGQLQSLQVLSSFLIVLSKELRVYDVVGDELRYGITIPEIEGVTELLQLSVDRKSGHFAVALPVGEFSSIGVFDPEEPEPLLVRSVPHRVISLITSPDTSGFICLDDSAQIWTIGEDSDPSSLAAIQPLEDLRLDGPTTSTPSKGVAALIGEDEAMASDDEDEQDGGNQVDDMDMDDDDTHASVVAQQHLADIFDAAPAFAAPSVEDMFYKVTSLLGSKPLVAASE